MPKFSENLTIKDISVRCEGVYQKAIKSSSYEEEDEHFELTLESIIHNREDIYEIVSEEIIEDLKEQLIEILNT